MLHEFIILDARNIIIISFCCILEGIIRLSLMLWLRVIEYSAFKMLQHFSNVLKLWRHGIWLQNFFEFQDKKKIWIASFQAHVQRFKDMRLHLRYNANFQISMIRRFLQLQESPWNLLLFCSFMKLRTIKYKIFSLF